MSKKKWFNIAKVGSDVAEIYIFGEIGTWGITVSDFSKEFNEIKNSASIEVYINSPGGSLVDGLAIYNILSSVRNKLTTINVGLAASISSIIFLAGETRIGYENSFYMIHNPSAYTYGGSDDLRRDADLLDQMKRQLVQIYKSYSTLSEEEIEKFMDDETWLNGNDAMKYGFVTEVEAMQAVACAFNLQNKGFKKVPKNLIRQIVNIKDINIRDFEEILRDAGFSKNEATQLASRGYPKVDESESQKPNDLEVLRNMLLNAI